MAESLTRVVTKVRPNPEGIGWQWMFDIQWRCRSQIDGELTPWVDAGSWHWTWSKKQGERKIERRRRSYEKRQERKAFAEAHTCEKIVSGSEGLEAIPPPPEPIPEADYHRGLCTPLPRPEPKRPSPFTETGP
jgi:hypothetical protein